MRYEIRMRRSGFVEIDFRQLARLDDDLAWRIWKNTIAMADFQLWSYMGKWYDLLASSDVVKSDKLRLSIGLFVRHLREGEVLLFTCWAEGGY